MRSRKAAQERAAEITRQRMALLSAELAALREAVPETGRSRTPQGGASTGGAEALGPVDAPASLSRARDASGPGSVPAPTPAPGRHARRPVPAAGRMSGWLHDRLPPTLQGRVGLTPGHLGVLAVLVLASLAVTGWWVVRSDGGVVVPTASRAVTPTPLVTPAAPAVPVAATAESPSPSPGGAVAGAGEAGEVVVDVAGKVRRPGIVSLPTGSRVVDAIEAAGGARRGVDLTSLNLARVLVDGEQIVVGVPPPAGVAPPAASGAGTTPVGASGPLVNINTADQVQLEGLPGVGPVTAAAILQWRSEHGAFTAVDELLEVSGIGDATLAEIAPFVTL